MRRLHPEEERKKETKEKALLAVELYYPRNISRLTEIQIIVVTDDYVLETIFLGKNHLLVKI